MTANRMRWIDNLKLIAAGGVFLGHFAKAFVEGNKVIVPHMLQWNNRYPMSGILNGEL